MLSRGPTRPRAVASLCNQEWKLAMAERSTRTPFEVTAAPFFSSSKTPLPKSRPLYDGEYPFRPLRRGRDYYFRSLRPNKFASCDPSRPEHGLENWLAESMKINDETKQRHPKEDDANLQPSEQDYPLDLDFPIGLPPELQAFLASQHAQPEPEQNIPPPEPEQPPETEPPLALDHPPDRLHPAVLILTGAPTSLSYTDFWRIASQGSHLDGWVKGLDEVHRIIDPRTGTTRGQYFLIFDTHLAAEEYATEIVQRRRDARSSNNPPSPSSPTPTTTPRAFTLMPPSITLSFRIYPLSKIMTLADGLQTTTRWKPHVDMPASIFSHLARLRTQDAEPATHPHSLLLRLHGGRLSEGQVLESLAKHLDRRVSIDRQKLVGLSRYRSELSDGTADGVPAVDVPAAAQKWVYTRFVLQFDDAVEMDRFVRIVHKREVPVVERLGKLDRGGRTVMMDCTKLSM
ncbi:hypothetical protein B0T16DRAFT_416169 [Cercophora newfieldiana]|uniref:Uncharacterized protein n=1 Tax=Cercophora newfieldiana TaxID=92897 RepID=A0AA39Y068_9PEZI|nr:hypothetical protein B0T16DRAFT_416169 [Cercophora newfieldiana]